MNKKTLAVIMSFALAVMTCGNVFASPSANTSSELKQAQDNKRQLEAKVGNLNEQINSVIEKIEANKKDMNSIAKNIKNTQAKLEDAKNNSLTQNKLFKERIRAMYINGTDGYLAIMLSSKDLSDFLSRVDTITRVIKFDNSIIAKLKKNELTIENEKKTLNAENNRLQSLRASNETVLAKLNNDIKQQKQLLSNATEKEQQLLAEQNSEIEQASHSTVAMAGSQSLSRGSIGSAPASSSRVITMQATAYCDNGYTASGMQTRREPGGYSTIAVDPTVIPLGSKVYVEGYGYAIAADIGGAIKGGRIDLFVPSQAEAQSWGRRSVNVYILS
ncbi:MAG: 3D domain-containing protein [Clostridium luticellarii]|uniref:3D domain-containing protein n=1 Tax=Clostridium luticellarii TaxID=1691940 RepID=UPI002354FBEF|nr:3D domain-containing protein [Clostridium luticellarii]MCI1995622.1 3D domain-containing protein [Clostridium luticellarii]MCI2040010.1 3D domain-containing protein [Clostridium luticellarii]